MTMKVKSIIFSLLFFLIISSCTQQVETVKFLVGTNSSQLKSPIKLYELNPDKGTLVVVDSFPGSIAPSYINFSSDGNYLFAGSIPSLDLEGIINSYKVTKNPFELTLINSQSSKGVEPTHLTVHPNGKTVFAANYVNGIVAALPIDNEGKLDTAISNYAHEGSGIITERQASAHAHFISPDPSGKYVLSVDLGANKIFIYSYDENSGSMKPYTEQSYLKLEDGAGPRHLVFHPSGKYFYVVNELNSTLSFCSFDINSGKAEILKTISTLPEGQNIENYPAAVRIHKNGKFLYSSNRGENSIALYSIASDGTPALVETTSVEGDWPRDFNIDPTGEFLIVANQKSNNLTVFTINQEDGTLKSLGISEKTAVPTCVLFVE